MGTMGISLVVITHEQLKKVCPKEFKKLEKAVENCEANNDMDSFMREFNESGGGPDIFYTEEEVNILRDELEKLQSAFTKKYPGLYIVPFYQPEDAGDRYDDFSGDRWEVCGAWEKTPMAKKLEKKIGAGSLDFSMVTSYG